MAFLVFGGTGLTALLGLVLWVYRHTLTGAIRLVFGLVWVHVLESYDASPNQIREFITRWALADDGKSGRADASPSP